VYRYGLHNYCIKTNFWSKEVEGAKKYMAKVRFCNRMSLWLLLIAILPFADAALWPTLNIDLSIAGMRQYTRDFEPVAEEPFDDSWESELTGVSKVRSLLAQQDGTFDRSRSQNK
jgi:hypothetical protein